MLSPITVTVTGAGGQIGYALLFRIASGEVFGPDQPIKLRLLEVQSAMSSLEGVIMELEDCAYPLLQSVHPTTDLMSAFEGTSWAVLVGSAPRHVGMDRRDLLGVNGRIFAPQGVAINRNAAPDVRVLVVGNPCNTNCYIARANARDVPDGRWHSMMRLDHNRARRLLADKARVSISDVTNIAVWGNHSDTQFPDFANAKILGKPVPEVLDLTWLHDEFVQQVRSRGDAIITARGASSAASAASAIIDSIRSIKEPTPQGEWLSVAIPSDGQYGVQPGIVFGFPVRSDGNHLEVVEGIRHDEFAKRQIRISVEELIAERDEVADLVL